MSIIAILIVLSIGFGAGFIYCSLFQNRPIVRVNKGENVEFDLNKFPKMSGRTESKRG